MAYVRQAVMQDSLKLAPNMRKADKIEIKDSDNVDPLQALIYPFTSEGNLIYSIVDQEKVIGMFGSVPTNDKDFGVVWMLSSEDLFKFQKRFIKESPYWIERISDNYKYVYNFVDERNVKSIRWLKYLGFKIEQKFNNYGYAKKPFLLMMKGV